jgi:pyruvate/2-oxoglutarate dehydrogenase complex dihydrolipoamide dehydrogenase (E3) component
MSTGVLAPPQRRRPDVSGIDHTSAATGSPVEAYDVVVLGAGPVGENAADRAVQGGLTAAVVEAELVGGECSYWACMPSKALLRSGQVLRAAQAVPGAREAVTGTLDTAAVLRRRDAFASGLDDSSQVSWLAGAGIALVRGHGRLVGDRRVRVTSAEGSVRELVARHAVVVATGSATALPPVAGLADAEPWTNREATTAASPPRRLAVLGGGVVAAELATAWRDLGTAHVVVLERGPALLSRLEPFAGEAVTAGLRARGIDVRVGVDLVRVERPQRGGPVILHLADGQTLVVDDVLVAAGRRPRTDDLGLETVGLSPGRALQVDDTGVVTAVAGGWLYAAGDVTGRAPLTHHGKYQARAVGDAIAARAAGRLSDLPAPWGRYTATADHTAITQVVFSDPEVAAVGLTEQQARTAGLDVAVARVPLESTAGAALSGEGVAGWAQLVVDVDRSVVVGATFVGPDVAELLHAATVAVVGEVPIARLWHAVPAFPTVSEVWLRLLEAFGRDSAEVPADLLPAVPA